jgi:hypothetical protein
LLILVVVVVNDDGDSWQWSSWTMTGRKGKKESPTFLVSSKEALGNYRLNT